MGKYEWHGTMWSRTGCPGEFLDVGWYTKVGDKFIVGEHRNPRTGNIYTEAELDKIQGVIVPPYVPYTPPAKPASAASVWILGVIVLVLAAGIVWFVTK